MFHFDIIKSNPTKHSFIPTPGVIGADAQKGRCNLCGWPYNDHFIGRISASPKYIAGTPELLPTSADERKKVPVASGVLDYFTSALIEVAKVSFKGNEQHNPGQPLHWARGKSTDQDDTIIRHFLERGKIDSDGMRHSAKLCWRALALLQLELEAEGAPVARGAKLPEQEKI